MRQQRNKNKINQRVRNRCSWEHSATSERKRALMSPKDSDRIRRAELPLESKDPKNHTPNDSDTKLQIECSLVSDGICVLGMYDQTKSPKKITSVSLQRKSKTSIPCDVFTYKRGENATIPPQGLFAWWLFFDNNGRTLDKQETYLTNQTDDLNLIRFVGFNTFSLHRPNPWRGYCD